MYRRSDSDTSLGEDGVYARAGLDKGQGRDPLWSWPRCATARGHPDCRRYRESIESWAPAVLPEAAEQRCLNHRILNVPDKLPKARQARPRSLMTKIRTPRRGTRPQRQKRAFQAWRTKRGHTEVGRGFDRRLGS